MFFTGSLNITVLYNEFSNGKTLIPSTYPSRGGNNHPKLVLNNIHLKNPVQGTLYTNMPNFEFKKIVVDDECKCETVKNLGNLACDNNNFGMKNYHGSTSKLSCDELKNKLINATFCQVCLTYFT